MISFIISEFKSWGNFNLFFNRL